MCFYGSYIYNMLAFLFHQLSNLGQICEKKIFMGIFEKIYHGNSPVCVYSNCIACILISIVVNSFTRKHRSCLWTL